MVNQPAHNTLFPCPCCGYCTLGELAAFEICRLCCWQDDGQDNKDANEVRGGPNGSLSLTEARVNVLRMGVSCLNCSDASRDLKEPIRFSKGREFTFDQDGCVVCEPASGWSSSAFQTSSTKI